MRFEQLTAMNFKNNYRHTEALLFEKLLNNAKAFIEREGDTAFLDKLKQRGCAIFASDENVIIVFGIAYFIGVRKVERGYFIEAMRTIENTHDKTKWTDSLFDGFIETSFKPTSELVNYLIRAFEYSLKNLKKQLSFNFKKETK